LEQCKCLSLAAYDIGGNGSPFAQSPSRSPFDGKIAASIAAGVLLTFLLVGFGVFKFRGRRDAAGHKGRGRLTTASSSGGLARSMHVAGGEVVEKNSSFGDQDQDAPPPVITIESPVPLPPYWATSEGMHIFPDPNRIQEVQRLMSETWKVRLTRDRRLLGGTDSVPTNCRVASVLRIENHRGYQQYWKHKAEVTRRRAGQLEPFTMETDHKVNLLDDDWNEKYLFHGTNPEAADEIARNLFSIDLAGTCRGSMFGPGIYLAENASKSDEYAKEGAGVYVGMHAMLICRAVAGRVFTAEASVDCSEHVRSGEYDSVCGDRLAAAGTFREMIFFHEQAVYPEFIVIYARERDG